MSSMAKIVAVFIKEFHLLLRDRATMLVLFLMPSLLVVVITLVQENVMELTGQKPFSVLVLDLDDSDLGGEVIRMLQDDNFKVEVWRGDNKTEDLLQRVVKDGQYQAGVVIEPGFEDKLARQLESVTGSPEEGVHKKEAPVLKVFVDPGMLAGLRNGLLAQLDKVAQTIAMDRKMAFIMAILSEYGLDRLKPGLQKEMEEILSTSFIKVEEKRDGRMEEINYNPVQQNVVAWAVFGMFFTAIALASSLLEERNSGIWTRLRTLPVSSFCLLGGKIVACLAVCFCQFFLICAIGVFVFPLLGLPAFVLADNLYIAILLAGLVGLAACCYGVLLGSVCSRFEQVSMAGATSIVLAAAIGGVMVPVYAMPELMRKISSFSPMNWALSAFQDILVRGRGMEAVLPESGKLVLFSLLSIIFALFYLRLKRLP